MTSQRLTQILSGQNVRLTATRQSAYPSFLFHCYSDPETATIDQLESAIWDEVSHIHKNGDWREVMDKVTSCYQAVGDQLTVEFLAQQIARVVREHRAKPKPRVADTSPDFWEPGRAYQTGDPLPDGTRYSRVI